MNKAEIEELKRFAKRRAVFGGDLSVKNVHNVPNLFPEMYRTIFQTGSLRTDLFCTNSPKYSDADESVVEEYENWLRNEGSGDE
ncbi:hypothetical protein [Lactococcus lactis]|uniref:hypothetical protein n=1 Tax=Lactococcus lactis TaxID=1358 RepID=UPI0024A8BE95|nr:hypothetical protein [Lactococcus lactis]